MANLYHAKALRELLTITRHGPREGTRRLMGWPMNAWLEDLDGAEYVIEQVYASMCGREPKPLEQEPPMWAAELAGVFRFTVKQRFPTPSHGDTKATR